MQDKIDYTKIIGIKVFLEIVSKRILVGDLVYKTGNYVFTYDDKYLNYKKAIPLGPELPLTKQSFQDTKIFESFWDRIPSKHNLFYPEYCRQFNIDPNEDNILVLLATIGSMVPSSFIFEPLWEDSFTGVTLRVFRGILELSTRDFASAFGISQATIVRIENNNASGTEILKFLEILYKFPETAAIYYVRKYGKLHSRIKEKVILTLNVMHSLIKAAYFGKIKVVKALLSNPKFDINERCAENGKTALHWAAQYAGCKNDHFEILKLLLEHTGIDVNIKDKNDHTALYYAAENGSVNAVNLLAPKTDYEELKKVHDIAQPPPDDRKKVCEILENVLMKHTGYVPQEKIPLSPLSWRADTLTKAERSLNESAIASLIKVKGCEKLVRYAQKVQKDYNGTIQKSLPFPQNKLLQLKQTMFEVRFATAINSTGCSVQKEYKTDIGNTDVDFEVTDTDGQKWLIELTSPSISNVVKEHTKILENGMQQYLDTISPQDPINSAEVIDIVKAQNAILSKVADKEGKPTKFPLITGPKAYHIIVVSMNSFNNSSSNEWDYLNIVYGSRVLTSIDDGVHVRYWYDPKENKKEMIKGVFDPGHDNPRTKILQEKVHAVVFIKEDFEKRDTNINLYVNPKFDGIKDIIKTAFAKIVQYP